MSYWNLPKLFTHENRLLCEKYPKKIHERCWYGHSLYAHRSTYTAVAFQKEMVHKCPLSLVTGSFNKIYSPDSQDILCAFCPIIKTTLSSPMKWFTRKVCSFKKIKSTPRLVLCTSSLRWGRASYCVESTSFFEPSWAQHVPLLRTRIFFWFACWHERGCDEADFAIHSAQPHLSDPRSVENSRYKQMLGKVPL